jgi:hypothetical protein
MSAILATDVKVNEVHTGGIMVARNGDTNITLHATDRRQAETVQQAVEAMPDEDKKMLILHTVKLLPSTDRRDVVQHIAPPTHITANYIWLIVISAFSIVLVGSFLTLAVSVFVAGTDGTTGQVILTMFTSVVGFLAGIFVPSPGRPDRTNDGG